MDKKQVEEEYDEETIREIERGLAEFGINAVTVVRAHPKQAFNLLAKLRQQKPLEPAEESMEEE